MKYNQSQILLLESNDITLFRGKLVKIILQDDSIIEGIVERFNLACNEPYLPVQIVFIDGRKCDIFKIKIIECN